MVTLVIGVIRKVVLGHLEIGRHSHAVSTFFLSTELCLPYTFDGADVMCSVTSTCPLISILPYQSLQAPSMPQPNPHCPQSHRRPPETRFTPPKLDNPVFGELRAHTYTPIQLNRTAGLNPQNGTLGSS